MKFVDDQAFSSAPEGQKPPSGAFSFQADALMASGTSVLSVPFLGLSAAELEYQASLRQLVDEKLAQIERISAGLAGALHDAQKGHERLLRDKPGRMALPGRRAKWQAAQSATEARMRSITRRLNVVHTFSPTGLQNSDEAILPLAVQKLRRLKPDLVKQYDQCQLAKRIREAEVRELRKREQKLELLPHSLKSGRGMKMKMER